MVLRRNTMKKITTVFAAALVTLCFFTACPDGSGGDKEDPMAKDHWKVTFNLNYEGAVNPKPVWVPKAEFENTLGDNYPEDPVRAGGWAFDGWFDGEIKYGIYVSIEKNIVLTARWTKLWTVTFDSNFSGGQAYSPVTVRNGNTITLPSAPTGNVGYNFTGWYEDPDDANTLYSNSTPITKNVTLKAGWFSGLVISFTGTPDPLPDAFIQVGGSLGSQLPQAVNLPEGFTFGGWFDPDGSEVTASTLINELMTLTAKWNKGAGIERIGAVDNSMALWKFTVPEGDAFGNYTKITLDVLINHENTSSSAPQTRLYGNYPAAAIDATFKPERSGAVRFAHLQPSGSDLNGPYILHNWKTHSTPRNVWRTFELPFNADRHSSYVSANFPAADATGDFYFCFSLSTQGVGSPAPVPFPPQVVAYYKNIQLSNDDGTKTIVSPGSGFSVPAYIGWSSAEQNFSRK